MYKTEDVQVMSANGDSKNNEILIDNAPTFKENGEDVTEAENDPLVIVENELIDGEDTLTTSPSEKQECEDIVPENTDDGNATYEEPWDLRAARIGLETRLRAVHSSPDQLGSLTSTELPASTNIGLDPRPAYEYDEPWDRRAKDVQRNLITAKAAKEEARMQREAITAHSQSQKMSSCRHYSQTAAFRQPSDSRKQLSSSSTKSKMGKLFFNFYQFDNKWTLKG